MSSYLPMPQNFNPIKMTICIAVGSSFGGRHTADKVHLENGIIAMLWSSTKTAVFIYKDTPLEVS